MKSATGKYLAATHGDNTLVGAMGLFPQAPNATSPARPGEIVILYCTGFGATNPAIPAGQLTCRLASTATSPAVTIGGLPAKVQFAGLIPGYAGLYQFNVEVPAAMGDGDQAVVAGVSAPAGSDCCFITVQR